MTDERKSPRRLSRKVGLAVIIVATPILLWLEFGNPTLSADPRLAETIKMTLTRTIGAVVFLTLLLTEGYRILHPARGFRPFGAFWLFFLPPLAVALNNLPIIGLLSGEASVLHTAPSDWIWYAAMCLSIGLFEEFAFRGVILLMFAEKRHKTRAGLFMSIILTSAVFGLVHLVNLAMGAGILGVIRQIGYSFLIGAMCAVVLFKTRNIWLCVLLHATFDFGGMLLDGRVGLGAGRIWNVPTIVITVVLAVATTAYLVWQFFRLDLTALDDLYPPKKTRAADPVPPQN